MAGLRARLRWKLLGVDRPDPRAAGRLRARVRRRLPGDGARLLRPRDVGRRGARALPRRARRRDRAGHRQRRAHVRPARDAVLARARGPREPPHARRPALALRALRRARADEGRRRDRSVDPAGGRREVDRDELSESFTGVALGMEPGESFEQRGDLEEEPAWRLLGAARLPRAGPAQARRRRSCSRRWRCSCSGSASRC